MSEQDFITHLGRHFQESLRTDALALVREKSWQSLIEIGLPSKSHEAFRYVSFRDLYLSELKKNALKEIDKAAFCEEILPECLHSHIVFIDGHFSESLSDISAFPSQTILLPLDKAMQTHGSFLKNYFARSLKEEKDPFAHANLAVHPKGAFFYLPSKLEVEVPLQCLWIATGDEPVLISPRLHIVLGAQSRMRCLFTAKGRASHFSIPTEEIFLEEGACLDLLHLLDTTPAWHFETLRASLKKDARLNSLSLSCGGRVARQSYHVYLKGEGSEANLSGLWMLDGTCTAHTHATIEHEAPHTCSMQRFKGVLNGHSQSSFEGKILVHPQAQKTQAYQLNNNLLVSRGAIANSKPNLEVFADDVKASHGATVSQLHEEQLFYLSTRGIDLSSARRLLIRGFCREMIDGISYDALSNRWNLRIEEVAT